MFILGVMGIIQAAFLPGAVFVRFVNPKGGIVYKISLVLASSLLINFLLVQLFRLIQIYSRTTLLVLFTLEVAGLVLLNWKPLRLNLDGWGQRIIDKMREVFANLRAIVLDESLPAAVNLIRGLTIAAIFSLALVLILWFAKYLVTNIGTVINEWDALHSWNNWAVTWALNLPFKDLTYYPQLIPINLSIPYVFIGNVQVNFFSKAFIPLFSLLIVLLLFEEGIKQRRFGYFIAIGLAFLLVKKFLGEYITEPYADIPLAFMTLVAGLTYLRTYTILNDRKGLFLVLALAAAAGVTKQPGLYLLPVFMLLILLDGTREKTALVWFGLVSLGAVLIAGVEYFPKIMPAIRNFDQTGLATYFSITGNVHNTSSLGDRLVVGFTSLGKYAFLLIFTLPGMLLLPKKYKWVTIFVILPYSILWSVLASYDARNLAMIFPLTAVVTGLAFERIMNFVFSILTKVKIGRLPGWLVPFLGVITLVILGVFITGERIMADWTQKQKQIFAPGLNEQLYALDFSSSCQKILTNYPIDYLPGLEGHVVGFYYESPDFYQQAILDPSLCWLLIPPYADGAIQTDVAAKLENGTYQLLYTEDHWIAYRLIKIR